MTASSDHHIARQHMQNLHPIKNFIRLAWAFLGGEGSTHGMFMSSHNVHQSNTKRGQKGSDQRTRQLARQLQPAAGRVFEADRGASGAAGRG